MEDDAGVRATDTGFHSDSSWNILIVDDDPDVHEVTEFALRRTEILGHPLAFFHAHSAAEAISFLKTTNDIALILLDAVMETEEAGLSAVKVIREDLGLEDVRIILRTGQPGQVPELETIARYDINDYRTKDELTKNRLITVLTAALRSWLQIRRIQNSRSGLEKIIEASNKFMRAKGLKMFAQGVITQMAGLFDVEPEGLVCASSVKRNSDSSNLQITVIAAAGRFGHLIDNSVDALEDDHIRESIQSALKNGKSQFGEKNMTLYFSEPSGREFATWIDSPFPLSRVDSHLLEVFCTNISLSAANVNLVDQLENLAWVDQFLGIPNLTALLHRIRMLLESADSPGLEIALFDIDGFGAVNDLLGHDYGDEILVAVKNRLSELFQPAAELYRISSDVFALLVSQEQFAVHEGELKVPLSIDSQDSSREISLSVGVSLIDPEEGDASTQLRNAFIALKRAKNEGMGQIVRYSKNIGLKTRERLLLLRHLQSAFSRRNLYVSFQPQARLEDGAVYGVEALLRWRDEQGRDIPPSEFIPLAEKSGLIGPLGIWTLRESLKALLEIQKAGFPGFRLAVNVSPNQLRQQDFLELLDVSLREHEVPPELLEIEITESISMFSIEDVLRLLTSIRDRGISIAIDDFGTGYSSLSSIDQWPVNRIKIDRSFISRMEDSGHHVRLIDLVIPLSETLSTRVLAEGVETASQWNQLREMGCHDAQGYFLSPPLRLDELILWLKNRR